jgi:hypothetical protein
MSFEKEATSRVPRKVAKIVTVVLLVMPLALFLFGEVILHLWNWLMPALFHLPAITFWQGLGLLVLSWLFFGGLRGSGPRSGYRRHWRHGMQDRWEQMSPEEQAKFRDWLKSRCAQP